MASGALEMSNVNLAEEVVNDITSQNAFEANVSTLNVTDEMIGTILDIKK